MNCFFIRGKKFDRDFNIGYETRYSVKEITEKIVQLYGKEVKINYKNERRKNEIMDTVADLKKAKEKMSWKPHFGINEGLKSMLRKWCKVHG